MKRAAQPPPPDGPNGEPGKTLALLDRRLAPHRPVRLPGRSLMARAGIAVVLREKRGQTELLLMRRVKREGDPWSGDMSCPGGVAHTAGEGSLSAAIRETGEETGVDLARGSHLMGSLSDVPTRTHQRWRPMVVTPYVFRLIRREKAQAGQEASQVMWVPLDFLADPANAQWMDWKWGRLSVRVPCWRWEGHKIWGLTYIVLSELLEVGLDRKTGPGRYLTRLMHRP